MNAVASSPERDAPLISIGIIAWNEEKTLGATLQSLFGQSLFKQLANRGQRAEVICVANGCEDRTVEIAAGCFAAQARQHVARDFIDCRVVNLAARGKLNAWNCFVHSFSARAAEFLFLMDADILLQDPETLWKMFVALQTQPESSVAVDRPCKNFHWQNRKGPRARLSMSASRLTGAAPGQLCAQLYCIRAEIARNIYLPRDLGACEDGFIKALVCTDFLMHAVWPWRIQAVDAAHTFEAYTSLRGLLRNQKRQVIGQTVVHLLVDQYLGKLPASARMNLAEALRKRDEDDPGWLKRMAAEHARRVKFYSLYPGLLTHRFKALRRLRLLERIACLPAAVAASGLALASSFAAWRFLKRGGTNYWPRADRAGALETVGARMALPRPPA